MRVEILPESKRAEWDAYIENNNLAIAWQKFEWHDILKKHQPHEFLPLVATEREAIRGVLPVYVLKNKRFRSQFISVPFAVAGGIVSDSPEIDQVLLRGALNLAKPHGVTSLVLKQYKHRIEGDLRTDDTYHNRELSLRLGPERIWLDLEPRNREMITAAKERGLSLEFPSPRIDEFYPVLSSYTHRQGIPVVSQRWIEDLVLSGMYECALVRQSGRTMAGTLVKSFKKTASFPFTALRKEDLAHQQAAYWMYWELIKLFAEKGYEIFHSGRIPADEAVPDYRRGWNGTKYPYFYQYYPNTVGRTESGRKRGLKRRLFTRVWRLLPKPAAVLLSPRLIRNFP